MSALKKESPCHCDAYPFPHRVNGGACRSSGMWCGECGSSDVGVYRSIHDDRYGSEDFYRCFCCGSEDVQIA